MESDISDSKMMQGQLTFLFVALASATNVALKLFRYRTDSTYYDAGDALGTNYWKISN